MTSAPKHENHAASYYNLGNLNIGLSLTPNSHNCPPTNPWTPRWAWGRRLPLTNPWEHPLVPGLDWMQRIFRNRIWFEWEWSDRIPRFELRLQHIKGISSDWYWSNCGFKRNDTSPWWEPSSIDVDWEIKSDSLFFFCNRGISIIWQNAICTTACEFMRISTTGIVTKRVEIWIHMLPVSIQKNAVAHIILNFWRIR